MHDIGFLTLQTLKQPKDARYESQPFTHMERPTAALPYDPRNESGSPKRVRQRCQTSPQDAGRGPMGDLQIAETARMEQLFGVGTRAKQGMDRHINAQAQ
jgi:hypothetical protein